MKKVFSTLLGLVAALSLLMVGTGGQVSAHVLPSITPYSERVCPDVLIGHAHCDAIQMLNSQFHPDVSGPAGYHPADLQNAYKLKSLSKNKGVGETVAIVDAYDDPNAEADLQVYRKTFKLPMCSSHNGCFSKVDQNGGVAFPSPNHSWAEEISLDLDMVSAICPNCNILLVEANSASFNDLGTAVNTAANHADYISNSYSGSEFAGESALQDAFYTHPGIVITASSGDDGYPNIGPPAVFSTVTAVGGTSLTKVKNARGWSETAWSGSGSGCSQFIAKPAWQTDSLCNMRTVADPSTGVSIYDTYGDSGWLVFGGTSASSPIIASVFALAGNAAKIDPSYPYKNTMYSSKKMNIYDVTLGSNGTCGNSNICNAGTRYDGPTGLGTPKGVGAF